MNLFRACWDRVERAEVHRSQLVEVWNDYLDREPFDCRLNHEGEGIHILEIWQSVPPPPEFSLRLGEWLYHLRACLDHIVWATAAYVSGSLPPPDQGRLQYPIYESERAWRNNLSRLGSLKDHHREMLWRMQPFNSDRDANYLGVINNLARIDRHRRPNESTAYIAEFEPVVEVPKQAATTFQWGQRTLRDGIARAARLTVDPWDPGMSVTMNPRVGLDPEIGEWAKSPFWQRVPFGERLRMIQIFVGAEIAVYEYDCTGHSEKSDVLTDTYRAECDARSKYPEPATLSEPWEWSQPIDSQVSTEERFRGDDFPQHGAALRPRQSS